MIQVSISYEEARECGFRKPAKDGVGIYLRGDGKWEECERLPWPLTVCPCCGQGVKFAKGFTWINPMALFDPYLEPQCTLVDHDAPDDNHRHEHCWMCNPELLGSAAGLIWVGEKFYKTPEIFMEESRRMGISRKISAIPNGFEIGEHAIFLAHNKAIRGPNDDKGKPTFTPGVFGAFKPTRVELVIDDPDDVPEKAIQLATRLGKNRCSIIKVIRDCEDQGEWEDIE